MAKQTKKAPKKKSDKVTIDKLSLEFLHEDETRFLFYREKVGHLIQWIEG